MRSNLNLEDTVRLLIAVMLECGGTVTVKDETVEDVYCFGKPGTWTIEKNYDPLNRRTEYKVVQMTADANQLQLNIPNQNTGD